MTDFATFFGKRGQAMVDRYLKILPPGVSGAPPFAGIARKFMICCTARTGSTLLCQHLRLYGARAEEYFNPDPIAAERNRSGIRDYVELCSSLASANAGQSVFGVKGAFQCLVPLYLAGELPQALDDWRFVFLTRANLVRQAISLVLAQKRQSFFSWEAPLREITDADYSAEEIAAAIDNIAVGNAWWEKFFAQYGIVPWRTTYEALLADPDGTVADVARHCGLDPRSPGCPSHRETLPQTMLFNAIWEQRFREDARRMRP